MISELLLHAGLKTIFGAGDGEWLWVLKGRERSNMLELRSSVLPLVGMSGPLSSSGLVTRRFGNFLVFLLILVVGLATQMTLRQVERWN